MASVRDLMIGGVLSGVMTFGVTYFFSERENAQAEARAIAAEERAQAETDRAAKQARTWEFYRRFQDERMAASRQRLSDAFDQNPELNFNSFRQASPDADAFVTLATFYSDLQGAQSSDQLDHELVDGLFGPNILWWNERALPRLCRGFVARETDNFSLRALGTIATFSELSGQTPVGCPRSTEPVRMLPRPTSRPPG